MLRRPVCPIVAVVLALATTLLPRAAAAAVSIGNVTTNSADTSSLTTAHNHDQGTNGLIVASIVTIGAGRDVTNVTYGGNALTHLCTRAHNSGKPRVEIWYRASPATGSQNLVVTVSGGADKIGVGIVSYGNVDQTTPVQNCATARGTSAAPSVNVTSAAGNLVQDSVGHASVMALTPGGGQTERWDFSPLDGRHGGSTEAGAGAVTMSWSLGQSKEWAIAGFSIKAAACAAVADASYVAATATSGTGNATVYWSSANPALLLQKTAAFTSETPVNGTTYSVGATIGAATVVDNDTVAKTSFTKTGLTNGTTYYYKVFSRAAGPCYAPGTATAVSIKPQAGPHPSWSYALAGGSMLKAGIAGSGTMYTGSNAQRIISLSTTDGTQSWTPVATTGAVQGEAIWVPLTGGSTSAVFAGDQAGRVYSVNPSTGGTNWSVAPSGADAFQAATAVQLRDYSNAAFQAMYTTDVVFAATRNTSTTANRLYALRADTGATLWSFNGSSSYSMDYVSEIPYVDYTNNRIFVATRAGTLGTQSSLWVIDSLNGALLASFPLGHIQHGPTLSYDGATLYLANTSGSLYAISTATLATKWTTPASLGSAVVGTIWEDFTTAGRLYFSTASGHVWALDDPGAGPPPNTVAPVWKTAIAGPSSPLILDALYVGSSDGSVHRLDFTTGVDTKQYALGSTVGDLSTEDGSQLFAGTAAGVLYKLTLPLP